MAAQEITPIEIDGLYTITNLGTLAAPMTALTTDVADETSDVWFEVPAGRRAIQRILIIVGEGVTAAGDSNYTITVESGDMWAAMDKEITVTKDKYQMFMIEPAKHFNFAVVVDEGREIHMTFTPATGKKLKTDHLAGVSVIFLY